MNSFTLTADPAGLSRDATVVSVPSSVATKGDLLGLLAGKLQFPETFGGNWDALFDCLCDLSWVKTYEVVICHDGVPALSSDELKAYLTVLSDAVNSWRENPGQHLLIVAFPLASAQTLARIHES